MTDTATLLIGISLDKTLLEESVTDYETRQYLIEVMVNEAEDKISQSLQPASVPELLEAFIDYPKVYRP
jgi:hypothetical protein